MSTYKKRGQKKSRSTNSVKQEHLESTTAEVFNTLETSASKTEQLVSKYQNLILMAIILIALCSIITTSIVSIYPASRAAKLDTIQTLKYE